MSKDTNTRSAEAFQEYKQEMGALYETLVKADPEYFATALKIYALESHIVSTKFKMKIAVRHLPKYWAETRREVYAIERLMHKRFGHPCTPLVVQACSIAAGYLKGFAFVVGMRVQSFLYSITPF